VSSTATLVYTAYLGGLSASAGATLMASVPPPADILAFYGLRVVSDSTPSASPVVRTIVLGLNPVSTATATAVIGPDTGNGVESVTVTAAGSGYIQPPIVSFTDGRVVVTPAQSTDNAAAETVLLSNPNRPAWAQAYLMAVSTAIVAAGSGYSAETVISVEGALKPGGTQMVLTPTIAGGHITAVAITTPGVGYVGVPTITVVDPNVSPGGGGVVTVSMGVGEVVVLNPGGGYNTAPTVVLTPVYQAFYPTASNQASPLAELMTAALTQAMRSPVTANPPVIA
jgi:hypothetical protein